MTSRCMGWVDGGLESSQLQESALRSGLEDRTEHNNQEEKCLNYPFVCFGYNGGWYEVFEKF